MFTKVVETVMTGTPNANYVERGELHTILGDRPRTLHPDAQLAHGQLVPRCGHGDVRPDHVRAFDRCGFRRVKAADPIIQPLNDAKA